MDLEACDGSMSAPLALEEREAEVAGAERHLLWFSAGWRKHRQRARRRPSVGGRM
jgi:hypothetical protein